MRVRLIFLSLVAAVTVEAIEPVATVSIQEQWSGVFDGKEAVYHAVVKSKDSFSGRIGWRLSEGGRTVARKETGIDVKAGTPETVEIRLPVPPVKDGVDFEAQLSVSVIKEGASDVAASDEKILWIMGENAFGGREHALKNLGIKLFDPLKKTTETLIAAKIPFEEIGNVDACGTLKGGVLIIGEGISLKDYRGLGTEIQKAAATGVQVLCLAPVEGELIVAGLGDSDLPRPKSVSFRGCEAIAAVDKKLDAVAWPPDGKMAASSLKLKGERGPVLAEVVKGSDGWPWVEIAFEKGKATICGFGIIEKWNSGPVPRHFLAKWLEEAGETR